MPKSRGTKCCAQSRKKSGRDPETVNTTKLILGMIKERLTLLADLKRT